MSSDAAEARVTSATAPCCPITGLPAKRRIQNLSSRFLTDLWRFSFGVRTARQLAGILRFELWESPCGLAFFEPRIAGDKAFYDDLYTRLGHEGPWTGTAATRSDYARAATFVRPDDKVLDVGCGAAAFARHIRAARYVGLERSVEARRVAAEVRGETIAEHAARHRDAYEMVCAFHVIEHVAEPRLFVGDMLRCLRPGGRLVIAVPTWPSAMTDIPNFALNAPPHHLTWWSERSLSALADIFGLAVEAIEALPASPALGIVYWIGRAAPKLTGARFFRHAWSWHLGLLWSWLAGRVCNALLPMPARPHSFELLLVARKPG
jgi:SAM-dependent methyltransferase